MPDSVITLAQQQRRRLIARDEAELRRVIATYGRIYERIASEAELLGVDVAELGVVTAEQIRKMERYQDLLKQVQAELDRFSNWLGMELPETARGMVDLAGIDTLSIVRAFGIRAGFNGLPAAAIETLLGFLDPTGPLYDRLGRLGEFTARRFGDLLLEGLAMGKNPRAVARQLAREGLGMGLTDALRMTRTVNLYSYREASRANYQANSDVVEAWQWYAELDGDTCMACTAEHGNIYPLDQPLNGHYNCRCTALPVVIGADSVIQSGRDWFEQQSEARQRAMMGNGKYEAWKAGQFEFSALSREQHDDVYGMMRSETPLRDLVREESED